jgi:hypothetical protein
MTTFDETALEDEITRFFAKSAEPHHLPEIVRRFRPLADDASIKATLLRLNHEGIIEITPEWEFRGVSSSEAV